MESIIAVLIIIIGVLVYISFNLYLKFNKLKHELTVYVDSEDRIITLLDFLLSFHTKTLNELKRVDRLGSFEADDEVGFTFKAIVAAIEGIKQQTKIIKKNLQIDDKNVSEEK